MADHALVLLDYAIPGGASDSVYLDASVREQHTASAEVTKHQVETGQSTSDYIRPMPRKITIEGFVTNTPIDIAFPGRVSTARAGVSPPLPGSITDAPVGAIQRARMPIGGISVGGQLVSFTTLQFSSAFDRVRAVYGSLLAAVAGGALFRVFTTLAVYQGADGSRNMALVNFGAPRDVEHGNAVQFSLDFEELRFATTTTVNIPQSIAKKKRGAKANGVVDPKTDPQSASVLDSIFFGGK